MPAVMPLADQSRELRIQAEGLLMHAEMLDWERTGDFAHHGDATRHLVQMQELIKSRPAHVCAQLEQARGLS